MPQRGCGSTERKQRVYDPYLGCKLQELLDWQPLLLVVAGHDNVRPTASRNRPHCHRAAHQHQRHEAMLHHGDSLSKFGSLF